MTIVDKIGLQQAAEDWKPEFEYVESIEEAAHLINLSHEDYPYFCVPTHQTMLQAIQILKEGQLKEFDIKALHGMCMKDKPYIPAGSYRTQYGTMVGDFEPPHPMYIPQLMMTIFPIDKDLQNIEMWYRLFECIHPFEDGNGRMGGVIIAAISFLQEGRYLVPKRETKETLRMVEIEHVYGDGCLYKLNQPAIVFENGIMPNDQKYKIDYFNQTNGVLCREDGFKGVLYALPYHLTTKKPFNPSWWNSINWSKLSEEGKKEEFVKGTIKKIEKILVKHTSIEYIKINSFSEASAFCEVRVNGYTQDAWLTWENSD